MNTTNIRQWARHWVVTHCPSITTSIARSFLIGMAFGLGMLTMGIMAVSVTGTIKTWATGDTLTATDLNTAITSVKTAVEGIPNWAKATNGTDATYTAGNVGIGTTSPSVPLHIQSNLSNTPDTPPYNSALTIESDGNTIGRLGIISYTSASPTINFYHSLNGKTLPGALTTNSLLFGFNGYGYNGSSWSIASQILARATENWSATSQGSYIQFNTTANGTTNVTEAMRIDQSGNVRIGTTTPASKLTITQTAGTNAEGIRLVNGSVNSYIYSDAGGRLHLESSTNSNSLVVQGDGNVGIGTTSPSSKLQVNGRIVSATKSITTGSNSEDVSGVNTLFCATNSGAITLGGLSGGVNGQQLVIINSGGQALTVKHNFSSGTQKLLTSTSADISVPIYGHVIAVSDGVQWFTR